MVHFSRETSHKAFTTQNWSRNGNKNVITSNITADFLQSNQNLMDEASPLFISFKNMPHYVNCEYHHPKLMNNTTLVFSLPVLQHLSERQDLLFMRYLPYLCLQTNSVFPS